jgi:hypothetical protein
LYIVLFSVLCYVFVHCAVSVVGMYLYIVLFSVLCYVFVHCAVSVVGHVAVDSAL